MSAFPTKQNIMGPVVLLQIKSLNVPQMYLGKLVTWHANTDAVPRWLPKLEINIFFPEGEKNCCDASAGLWELFTWWFNKVHRVLLWFLWGLSFCQQAWFSCFSMIHFSWLARWMWRRLSARWELKERKKREKDLKSPKAASAVGQTYISARAGEESTSKPHNTVQTWNEHES